MACCHPMVRIVISVIAAIALLCAVFVFVHHFRNHNATAWAAVATCVSVIIVILHVLEWRGYFESRFHAIMVFLALGCLFAVAGLGALIGYIVKAAVTHQGISGTALYGENYWCGCGMGCVTMLKGIQMSVWAWMYRKDYYRRLVVDDEQGGHFGSGENSSRGMSNDEIKVEPTGQINEGAQY